MNITEVIWGGGKPVVNARIFFDINLSFFCFSIYLVQCTGFVVLSPFALLAFFPPHSSPLTSSGLPLAGGPFEK